MEEKASETAAVSRERSRHDPPPDEKEEAITEAQDSCNYSETHVIT